MDKLKINRFLTLSLTTAISLAASTSFAQAQDTGFGSPIIDAADHGDISQVQSLIQSGTNPNQQGELGITSLMRAVYNNNAQLVGMLLQNGASPEIKDVGGASAILIAAREGHNEILQLLVQHGSDVNARDSEGFTPLMRAAIAGNQSAIQFLLQHGANPSLANNFGETAISQANSNGQQQVAALLTNDGQAALPAPQMQVSQADNPPVIVRSNITAPGSEEIAETNKADIVIDMSGGRLGQDRAYAAQPQQVATISNPQVYSGSVYMPVQAQSNNLNANQDSIQIPQKPDLQSIAQAQPRVIPVSQNLLGDMGQIATQTLKPYQLASNQAPQNSANEAQINTFEIQVTPGQPDASYKTASADSVQMDDLRPAANSSPDQANAAPAPIQQVPSLPPLKSVIAPASPAANGGTPNSSIPPSPMPSPPAVPAAVPTPAPPVATTPPSSPPVAATPPAPPVVTPPAPPQQAPVILNSVPSTVQPAVTPQAANDNEAVETPASEEAAPTAPVKKKHRFYRKMKIPAAGQGAPPRDLVTGQPLGLDAATGKFEVARPVKAIGDSYTAVAPAWIKIDHFNSPQAAHEFINNLREQNPNIGSFRSRVSAPFTRPEATTAQIGPFTDQTQIQQICASVTQTGMTCSTVNSSSPAASDTMPTAPQMQVAPNYSQGGDWTIQLGTYNSDTEAQQAWNDLTKHNRHLHKMQNYIVQADGGYRLRAGNFASSSQADSMCDQLRAKSVSCIIIKN